MKKVYLEKLPRYVGGRYDGKINWSASVGSSIAFIYENISGTLEILNYKDKQYLTLRYMGTVDKPLHSNS